MRKPKILMLVLMLMSAAMMSIPFLVPGSGWVALFGLVPLMLADVIAENERIRGFWWWCYLTFLLWNAATTFWVCNATVGGGIFASAANALQMTLIYCIARASRKKLGNSLSIIFLMLMWIAWERAYFNVDISWPWLTLGNAFAGTTGLVQWYEYTGTLGGSLWIWIANIWLFWLIMGIGTGTFARMSGMGKAISLLGYAVIIAGPMLLSGHIYRHYDIDRSESLAVVIGQPNFDPYEKFGGISRAEQDSIFTNLVSPALSQSNPDEHVLVLAPETFTNDIVNRVCTPGSYTENISDSPSWQRYHDFLQAYPSATLLFGASSRDYHYGNTAPNATARHIRENLWIQPRNSAITLNADGKTEVYHKNKLVVGVESTPYPELFTKIDDRLGGVMGRDIGDGEAEVLHVGDIPIGTAICYESVYGEFCTEYVRKGAKAMTVITNDAWWGDTPGYRQHLRYSALRAIELRRDIARCANTGISAIIDQRGDIVEQTEWWRRETISGRICLNDKLTFFAKYGDATGRICTFAFLLLLLALFVRLITPKR